MSVFPLGLERALVYAFTTKQRAKIFQNGSETRSSRFLLRSIEPLFTYRKQRRAA